MADKYLRLNNGVPTQTEATTSSAGASDAGKIPALDSGGRLDLTMMPTGVAPDVAVIASSENLAAGDLVNIWNDGGSAKVRKADASAAGKEAHGFVVAAVTAPANATVYFEGPNNQVSGLTPGPQYLSTTPGLATATPPSTAGQVVQRIGVATSATSMNFEAGQHYVL